MRFNATSGSQSTQTQRSGLKAAEFMCATRSTPRFPTIPWYTNDECTLRSETTIAPSSSRGKIQLCEWSTLSAANSPASLSGVVVFVRTESIASRPRGCSRRGSLVISTEVKQNSFSRTSAITFVARPFPLPSPPSTVIKYIIHLSRQPDYNR